LQANRGRPQSNFLLKEVSHTTTQTNCEESCEDEPSVEPSWVVPTSTTSSISIDSIDFVPNTFPTLNKDTNKYLPPALSCFSCVFLCLGRFPRLAEFRAKSASPYIPFCE
jgi:hypothetical protein